MAASGWGHVRRNASGPHGLAKTSESKVNGVESVRHRLGPVKHEWAFAVAVLGVGLRRARRAPVGLCPSPKLLLDGSAWLKTCEKFVHYNVQPLPVPSLKRRAQRKGPFIVSHPTLGNWKCPALACISPA